MRFNARLNFDLCALLPATPVATEGVPALCPRTSEARADGGRDSWVPADCERPTRFGFMLCFSDLDPRILSPPI